MRDFVQCIKDESLISPHTVGHWFLWHNIGLGHDRIASRIDHSFVNELWLERDFSSQIQYLNQSLSEHSPLLCTCAKRDRGKSRPFWFLN